MRRRGGRQRDPGTAEGWALLRAMLWQQRNGLAIGMLLGLCWTLGKVAVPKLTSRAVDDAVLGDDSLVAWSLLIGAAGVVAGLFTGLRRWFAFRESRGTEMRLREQLFDQIQRLHIGYHDRTQTGQLMSRASSDLQQIQGFVVLIPLTASNLAMVLAVVVVLAVQQPLMTLIALAPLPLLNVLATRFSHKIHPAVLAVQVEQGQLATVVEEAVSGVRVIKGFGAEAVIAERLRVEADDIRRESLKAARLRSAFLPALDMLPNIGLIAVLGIGGHRVVNGQMSEGELLEFMLYVSLLIFPLRNLGMTLAFGQRAAVALKRVNEVLSTVPEVADPAAPRVLPARSTSRGTHGQHVGAVHFEHVSFAYGDDALVLDDFDLVIAAGSSVALVGSTASGKSTAARLLVRFYDVDRGTVSIDGIDVRDLRLGDLRRAVSVVFEDTFLFHDTVAANIAFAEPEAPQEVIERAARLAGAHEFILELPDGYSTLLGERGFSLSGGQRQRIALARAILADPRVLILDDATSAVDPSKEHEIREAMATVMRGRTTIVIAHRAGTIALADTVVLIDCGRVAAHGPHQHLLDTSERYRSVLAALVADDEDDADATAGALDVAR